MAGAPLLDKPYTESDLNSEFDTSDILGTNYEWKEEDFYRRFFTDQVGSALSGNEQKACVMLSEIFIDIEPWITFPQRTSLRRQNNCIGPWFLGEFPKEPLRPAPQRKRVRQSPEVPRTDGSGPWTAHFPPTGNLRDSPSS
jgi:hypothetical protein